MEKILNEDEKIRRAEEIYFRRNNRNISLGEKEVTKNNKRYLGSRIFLNLLILLNISVLIFCIQNRNLIFNDTFLEKISKYNIDISNKFREFLKEILDENKMMVLNENTIFENITENNKALENKENIIDEIKNQNNITIEKNEITSPEVQEQTSLISEMNTDIENLKAIYSFVNPLKGIVSSGFGARESEYQNVTGYHTGIDIAADKGTDIIASMEGIVTLVSSEGDYGKHIKIRSNNVITLYAHCSKIFVKEGQIVSQGQKIAEVGSTGNSTGNHLHFEIRIDDRFIDPAKIINF